MQDQTTLVSILGSGNLATRLPGDLDALFSDGVLVNRNPARFGHPHEMAGYSAYLGLKALGLRAETKEEKEATLIGRKKILTAIINRLEKSKGFWQHSHLSVGGTTNHGLRSTAAAIKTLIIAAVDGLFEDQALIIRLLKKQLSYHEKLQGGGTWFFHDSVEGTSKNKKKGKLMNIGNAFGSTDYNALVLNTHVETLNTLMLAIHLLGIEDDTLFVYLENGAHALRRILGEDYQKAFKYKIFQQVETPMRRRYLGDFNGKKSLFNKIFNAYFWTYRTNSLKRMPGFQHTDGYLERALYYKSTTYNYHMVNLLDLQRFAKLYKKVRGNFEWEKKLQVVIKKAMDYAFTPAYLHYVKHLTKKLCTAVQLCEAIVFFWVEGKLLEKKWVDNYLKVRKMVPPSPAILGYDPAIVISIAADEMIARNYLTDKIDLFLLKNKEILLLNHSNEEECIVLDKRFSIQLLNGGKPRPVIPPQAAMRLTPLA